MQLVLPYPPSVNSVYRIFKNRILISEKGREYIELCISVIKDYMCITDRDAKILNPIHTTLFPLEKKLSVIYDVYPPDARRRDLANLDKVISDCCTKAGLWSDDFNIDKLQFNRRDVNRKTPCIIATIEELGI